MSIEERFFTVEPGSSLYEHYFQYQKYLNETGKAFDKISEEFGIESTAYLPYFGRFGIVPTNADEQKFAGQFTAKQFKGGLRTFKLRSPVNIAWTNALKDAAVKQVSKPDPAWELGLLGKSSYRLFDYKGTLYFSMERFWGNTEKLPSYLTEIKGSEFWQVIEEIEQK